MLIPLLRAQAQNAPAAPNTVRLEHDLKATMTENIRSSQAEDLEAMMKTIHSRSPLYESTKRQIGQILRQEPGAEVRPALAEVHRR